MSDIYRLPSKTWRVLSSILIAMLIVSLVASFTSITVYALDIPQPVYPVHRCF